MRSSVVSCVPTSIYGVVSFIIKTELPNRRDLLYGWLLQEVYFARLQRGDLAKRSVSALPTEPRFRAPPHFDFCTVPALPIASYTPALRPNPGCFDGSMFAVRLVYITVAETFRISNLQDKRFEPLCRFTIGFDLNSRPFL